MSTTELPDIVRPVIDYLLTTDVALEVQDRISGRSMENQPTPFVLVTRIAEAADNHHWVGRADLQIEAVVHASDGGAQFRARQLVEMATASLHDLPRSGQIDGIVIATCEDLSARALEDPITSNRRYQQDLRFKYHPGPSLS